MRKLFNFMCMMLIAFGYFLYLLNKIGFESFVVTTLVVNAMIGVTNTPREKGE